jgi:hypothetical protein
MGQELEQAFRFVCTPSELEAFRTMEREVARFTIGEPLRSLFKPTVRCSIGPGGILDVELTAWVPHRDTGE